MTSTLQNIKAKFSTDFAYFKERDVSLTGATGLSHGWWNTKSFYKNLVLVEFPGQKCYIHRLLKGRKQQQKNEINHFHYQKKASAFSLIF